MSRSKLYDSKKRMKSVVARIKAGESLRSIREDILKEEEE